MALSSLYIGYPSLYHRVSTTSGMYLASTSVFDLMFDGIFLGPGWIVSCSESTTTEVKCMMPFKSKFALQGTATNQIKKDQISLIKPTAHAAFVSVSWHTSKDALRALDQDETGYGSLP